MKVLLYMLTQPASVVKSWRKRQYFFASATIFRDISGPLIEWLYNGRDPKEFVDKLEQDPDVELRTNHLRKLNDYDGLYTLIGDVIIQFIKHKRAPFPGALLSQQNFLRYVTWKMAFIFVKLMREVTGIHVNKHWNKFGYYNYKINKRCFRYFCESVLAIWNK